MKFKILAIALNILAAFGVSTPATAQQECLKYTFRDRNTSCHILPWQADIPQVNPWKLSEPVVLQRFAQIKSPAPYYENVVLAGDSLYVRGFLEFHNLNVKVDSAFTRVMQPLWSRRFEGTGTLWAACNVVMGPGATRGSQMVCVAVDESGAPLDDRIFSREYANEVAQQIFSFD